MAEPVRHRLHRVLLLRPGLHRPHIPLLRPPRQLRAQHLLHHLDADHGHLLHGPVGAPLPTALSATMPGPAAALAACSDAGCLCQAIAAVLLLGGCCASHARQQLGSSIELHILCMQCLSMAAGAGLSMATAKRRTAHGRSGAWLLQTWSGTCSAACQREYIIRLTACPCNAWNGHRPYACIQRHEG